MYADMAVCIVQGYQAKVNVITRELGSKKDTWAWNVGCQGI
jgi:hypothetical protein